MARANDEFNKPPGAVIGQGFTIQAAKLTGSESIRIDGCYTGDIELDGTLHLSETGRIEGNILASAARIAGQVAGNIRCRSTLHLASTAVIDGDAETASIIVDEGAVLRGLCKTHSVESEYKHDAITEKK